MTRKLVTIGAITPVRRGPVSAPFTPTITLDGQTKRIPRQEQRLSSGRVLKGGATSVYVKIHRSETGRTTSEAPNPRRRERIDLAWLETQARKWADGRVRARTMKYCRCTGKCECL